MFNLLTEAWSAPEKFGTGDTLKYTRLSISDWAVYVNDGLNGDTATRTKVLDILRTELAKLASEISPRSLAILRTVPIYVEDQSPRNRWEQFATFHPSMDWLTTHGLDPRWAGAVQIVNAKNFLERYEKLPEMIVVLFADAYNSKALGFRDKHLAHLYQNAIAERKYTDVLSKFKRNDHSPAAKSERAYFQWISATFLHGASYYPFTKDKLEGYDPDMFKFLHECWEQ